MWWTLSDLFSELSPLHVLVALLHALQFLATSRIVSLPLDQPGESIPLLAQCLCLLGDILRRLTQLLYGRSQIIFSDGLDFGQVIRVCELIHAASLVQLHIPETRREQETGDGVC